MGRLPTEFTADDWYAPVRECGPRGSATDWTRPLLDQFGHLLLLVEPAREDSIGAEHWRSVILRFDQGLDPTTPDEANERWRELVVGSWRTVALAEERRLKQLQALRRRGVGSGKRGTTAPGAK